MNRATLIRAAEILEREAAVLARSYIVDHDQSWSNAGAKRDHDEMVRVSGALRTEAA